MPNDEYEFDISDVHTDAPEDLPKHVDGTQDRVDEDDDDE